LDDLVVVAEFRDTIYRASSPRQSLRGGDKPWHTVINGENYHVLKAHLDAPGQGGRHLHDPPYNTRDRDWKYNNDYVNADDWYRHSKWLAMMGGAASRRELLNPADSVQLSPSTKGISAIGIAAGAGVSRGTDSMVSSVINHSGVARDKEFYRGDEYLFFVFMGDAAVVPTGEDMLNPPESLRVRKLISGVDYSQRTDSQREDSEKQFTPFGSMQRGSAFIR
jgi:adenine-specific DNA-methyltransferase